MKITVRAIVKNNIGETLVVQHKGSDFWALPGGKIEGTEDLQFGLKREIFEELGCDSIVEKLLFVHEFQYESTSEPITEFFFAVTLPHSDTKKFVGELTAAELNDIAWKKIESDTNIRPKFLRNETNDSDEIKYFSYTNSVQK